MGALFLLGAYHGANPGMGWLFAVALGMQEKSSRAVRRALLPIALGHALAIGVVVLLVSALQVVVPTSYVRLPVGVFLVGLGLFKIVTNWHPRWVAMRVGFGDLTLWSFLMATAHGAGLMVLPLFLGMSNAAGQTDRAAPHSQMMLEGPWAAIAATLIHTLGYLLVTGAVAWLFYAKLGLMVLRKAWFNLDLIWAAALIATGVFTLLL